MCKTVLSCMTTIFMLSATNQFHHQVRKVKIQRNTVNSGKDHYSSRGLLHICQCTHICKCTRSLWG